MIENVKVAVVGVGNNTSALVQGITFYRNTGSPVGIHRPEIAGLGVGDIDFVAAFALSDGKVGKDLHEAIFVPPNNFPRLHAELPPSGVTVQRGLVDSTEVERVAHALKGAEVLLYSAPSGRPDTAQAYAEAALMAGVAFINTTSDAVAREPLWLKRFEVENSNTKKQSKLNAVGSDKVQMAPLGYLPHLQSQKIAHLNIEAQGWGETAVSLDVRLKVHDPSGAAGVNIDLIRIAAAALRSGCGGYPVEAASLLKSPPGTAI